MEFESVEEALEFLLDVNHQENEMRVATVNPDGTRSDFNDNLAEIPPTKVGGWITLNKL